MVEAISAITMFESFPLTATGDCYSLAYRSFLLTKVTRGFDRTLNLGGGGGGQEHIGV